MSKKHRTTANQNGHAQTLDLPLVALSRPRRGLVLMASPFFIAQLALATAAHAQSMGMSIVGEVPAQDPVPYNPPQLASKTFSVRLENTDSSAGAIETYLYIDAPGVAAVAVDGCVDGGEGFSCGALVEDASKTVSVRLSYSSPGTYSAVFFGECISDEEAPCPVDPSTIERTIVVASVVIPTVSLGSATGGESSGSLVFPVTLSEASSQAVTVQYATANGTATAGSDYTATSGTLTIPAGQTQGTITVPVLGDALVEPDETFTLALSNPTNAELGSPSVATGTITDTTPAPTLSLAGASAAETEASLAFAVTLSAASAQDVTVQYATANGTATADSDYTATSGTLTIAAGQTSGTITVPVLGDTLVEPDETFTLALSNPTNAELGSPAAANGTITNDDQATIEGGSRSIADGDSQPGVTAEFAASNLGTVDPGSLIWTVLVGSEVVDSAEGGATATLDLRPGENRVRLAARNASGGTSVLSEVVITVGAPGQIAGLIPELPAAEQEVAKGVTATCSNLQQGSSTALTSGQQQLLATCDTLFDAVTAGNGSAVRQALEQISGRQITTTQTQATDFSTAQLANVASRIRALRQGSRGISVAGLQFQGVGDSLPWRELYAMAKDLFGPGGASGDEDQPSERMEGRLGIFANGSIRFGDKDKTANEAGFDFDTKGITIGADYRIRDNLVLGAALGYGKSDTDFSGDGGTLDSDSLTGSLFGTWYGQNFYVDWIGSYGSADHKSVRNINISQLQISDVARGKTDGKQWALGLGAGYTLHQGGWSGGPNVSVSYVKVKVDGFAEATEGTSGLAMLFPKQSGQSLTVKAGGNVGYAFSHRWGVITPQIRADFVREFENDQRPITVHFANEVQVGPPGSPGTGFVVFTDDPDKYYFVWGASLIAQFGHGISGFVDYERTAGLANITSNEISFGLRIQTRF